jgi:hypothetical protein
MRVETELLAACLLKHQKTLKGKRTPDTVVPNDLVPYKRLCEEAGVPHLTRGVGDFLDEIAEWCRARGLPPLNSLAVNGETMMPGAGYNDAKGSDAFTPITWWKDVQACIAQEYPGRIA